MAKEERKEVWWIECTVCKTGAHVDIEKIIVTDQGAEFLREPRYLCGKCNSLCISSVVEKEQ